LRCHPVLPFEQVRTRLARTPEGLSNVEVSSRPSIVDDFARASALLYRGSSSILYAVLQGLKPLYLHDPRHHDMDPLFEVDGWRARVSSIDELAAALERFAAVDSEQVRRDWEPAAAYVDGYVMPVDDASIGRLLSAIGLSP
jgi:hypothetical protein